jgi:hypothetical protein
MAKAECAHSWQMVNVANGYIITEECSTCEKISTYFTFEDRPPLEEYREGEHFWNVMESAQSFRFDLKCLNCGQEMDFNELMGLMMCTGCEKDCQVEKIQKELEKDRTWVYVAYGFLPSNEHKQLTKEKIALLEDFFNQGRHSSNIKIVSQELVKNFSTCFGEIIKDVNLLSLTPPPEEG